MLCKEYNRREENKIGYFWAIEQGGNMKKIQNVHDFKKLCTPKNVIIGIIISVTMIVMAHFVAAHSHSMMAHLLFSMSIFPSFLLFGYIVKLYERDKGYIDSLTGVYNKTKLFQDLIIARENFSEFGLMFLDFNHFKKINDTKGHKTGDTVLRRIGIEMKMVAGDICFYRYGGDEFCCILGTPIEENIELVKSLNGIFKAYSQTLWGTDCLFAEQELSFSYGIAIYPNDAILQDCPLDEFPEHMIELADQKMYMAKAKYKQEHQPKGRKIAAFRKKEQG